MTPLLDDVHEDTIADAARALLHYTRNPQRHARAWYATLAELGMRATQTAQVAQLQAELQLWMSRHPSWVARQLGEQT